MQIKNMLPTFLLIAVLLGIFLGCKQNAEKTANADQKETESAEETYTKPRVPDWHKNANIYEVNLRHYTSEGTFKAFEKHVARLKDMGVDILWFMPIHEISKTKRKGGLGSPYAVNDYKDVNPDFGTMDDFKHMLKVIHDAGMYCLIDWVPNHTGWDNKWITEHPDWYTKGKDGKITDPINYDTGESWGWTDVADLNYDNKEMRKGMIDALAFWIKDVGIDGFRVDVAHGVPVDFWVESSDALYDIEPVFMLAEAEVAELRNNGSFIMDYAWEMHHLLNDIAKARGANQKEAAKLVQGNKVEGGQSDEHTKNATDIDSLLAKMNKRSPEGYAMQFTSNHDENSWAGTEMERMGPGHKAFAVLTATFNGMPLIYTGQESAMNKQLKFFEKDEIDWGDYPYAGFYKKLLSLKHRNKALWNGKHGGELVKIPTGKDEMVYAFYREKEGDKVVVIINLSGDKQSVELDSENIKGDYRNVMEDETTVIASLTKGTKMTMEPWSYMVLELEQK
ncbi:MAG: alpha-amylase family glycosyl hydrolase [Saprospiraceae bacterium]